MAATTSHTSTGAAARAVAGRPVMVTGGNLARPPRSFCGRRRTTVRAMRVLVSTTAGAGHLGPLVPFARALVDAGHEVVVAAPASFASAVEKAGFTHHPFADAAAGRVGGRVRPPPRTVQPRRQRHRDDRGVRTDRRPRRPPRPPEPGGAVAARPGAAGRRPSSPPTWWPTPRASPTPPSPSAWTRSRTTFLPGLEGPLADLGARGGVAGLRSAPRLSLLPPAFEGATALASGATMRFRDDTPGRRPGRHCPGRRPCPTGGRGRPIPWCT